MRNATTAAKKAPILSDDTDADEEAASGSLQAGVQSVEIAANILKALASGGSPLPLKGVAKAAHMSRAKVHRYLVSLKRAGLVAQDTRSGDYRIGPATVTLGLVGLRGLSPVRTMNDALPGLRDRIDETVTLAIWGETGPVITPVGVLTLTSNSPVTATSAEAGVAARITGATLALAAGANEYLMKPFTKDQLHEKLIIMGLL
jgi:DNA-binding IclR family transcriptional regulator